MPTARDRGAFDDGQDVALHALAAHIGALRAFTPGDFVDLVDEDDARFLDAFDRVPRDTFHVDELLRLFLRQHVEGLGNWQFPAARLSLKKTWKHVAQVHAALFDR